MTGSRAFRTWGTVPAVKRVIALVLVLAACGAEPAGVSTTTGGGTIPITTSPVTTSPVTTSEVTTSPISDGESPPGTSAEVVAVLDGDSLAVVIAGRQDELRLLGINAPEPGECYADEARSLLVGAVGDAIVIAGDERDQFGRILGYAYRGSANLNQWMIAQGGAIAMTPDHELLPDFLAAEQDAVGRGLGMWAVGTCVPEAGFGVAIYEVESDAPGRDDENPNGEFVVLVNQGEAADLSGWVLRDESSSHRYAFPDGVVLPTGGSVVIRSGCGADDDENLYWCEGGSVWNNDGDTAILIDADGTYVSRFRYFGE